MTARTLERVAEIDGSRQYIYAIMEDLKENGLIEFARNTSEPYSYGNKFRITAKGIDHINSLDAGGVFDSTRWTGIRKITPYQKRKITKKVDELFEVVKQSDLGDVDKQNALAHIQAVQVLLGAPDTPWRQVIELLNSRYLNAFMIVATILSMIFGCAQTR